MTRIAVIEKEKCNPSGCGGHLCLKLCPVNRAGIECIKIDIDQKPMIDETLCTGCGICQNRCPFGAIHIVNLPENLNTDPIHRYGKNGFALYSLPTPMFGKVVGIIGVNGIGKSTAIKILAGEMQANFGDARRTKIDIDKMIEYFKGTEAQIFFEKVRNGIIKVAYKPQNVDSIPKIAKGTVRALLEKVDEKKKLEEVSKEMEIDNILGHDIKKISGGELQRVAIAATVLKDANLFIFDEPTSYLDIKQRLKIARFLRNLATKDIAVIVIEHDLIALDYMTDLTHIMYGQPSVYGVVSNIKTTKAGINTYLDGYIKEDNVRFRDHKIVFDVRPPTIATANNKLTEWTGLKKKLNSFTLESENGIVYRREIVGVLGENGIGKTTFVKLLAGVEKPDSGTTGTEENLKVSYKPQYIDSSSEEQVATVLQDAVSKHTNDILKPLKIEQLFEKKICELSGGERQRVAIAMALSRDAELVLLDEPSAYLDVEQRIKVSKIINNVIETTGKSAIVVDHDLLFLDYLSQRILVFDGQPAKHGFAKGPYSMEKGMNSLLGELSITLRRDENSGRPRINKEESQKDRAQKSKGKLYYG